MPAKLESCVKQIMKEQGLPEERAWAICTASLKAADNQMILDFARTFKATVDTTTGFLTSPVNLARTGVQYYYGYELGLKDRTLERIGVYRPAVEVFSPESISSFINLVATDDHPSDMVNIDNVKSLQVGMVSNVARDGDFLSGLVTITDKKTISKIKDGKIEVSVGYTNKLKEEKGTFGTDAYEFVQTDIRANHLAIVDAGRCGSACKLTIDNKEKIVVITIDGIDYNVENQQLAQAIQNKQKSHDEEVAAMKKKLDEEMEEKEQLKKDKDQAVAAKDALEKITLDETAISVLVNDRAVLLTDAKNILGDKMPDCGNCPKEIKSAVIDHVLGETDLSGKSMDYIDAMYDVAIKNAKKAKSSVNNLTEDFKKPKEIMKDRETARQKYMKDQLKLEVV